MKTIHRIILTAIVAVFSLTISIILPLGPVEGRGTAPAATITVRSSADSGGTCPGANCTLRQAIATAVSGDTIDFDMTTVTSPITLASELSIDKDLTIQGPGASQLTISGNNAVRVFNIGSVTPAINVTLSALTIANGRHRGSDGNPGGNGFGAGILNNSIGNLTISNSVISSNSALGGNPIVVPSGLPVGGNGTGGGIYNASTGTLNITNCTISGNVARGGSPSAGNNGGGGSGEGGGIFNNGTVNLNQSTLAGNSATDGNIQIVSGSGVVTFHFGAHGGGISSGGTVNITNSTLSGNSANGGMHDLLGSGESISLFGSFGGGIYNSGGGTLRITNSTLFGNVSNGGSLRNVAVVLGGNLPGYGGGIANESAQLTITNSTIYGNTVTGVTGTGGIPSSVGEGGGVNNTTGTVSAKTTIIAGNTGDLGPDFRGTLTSQGWNLIGNNKDATIIPAPGTADQIGTNASPINPLLGPLANNGGQTQTLALLAGSPALDKGSAAIDPTAGMPVITDQRGLTRPVDNGAIANATGGDGSDIGAFEAQTAACSTLVTNTNDNGAGSLRAAVICSNLTAGTQTITFAAGLTGTITLTSGEMVIFDSVNIVGPGVGVVTVSGNNSSRIFNISTGNFDVAISGLTIANGRHRGGDGNPSGAPGFGGGILNDSTGTLSIANCVLSNNAATGGDAQLDLGGDGSGGGIYNRNTGTVDITGSTLSGNKATGGNAGIGRGGFASRGGQGNGAGIYNQSTGAVNITNSSLSGNSAKGGNAINNSGFPGNLGGGGGGGGIVNNGGTITLINSSVSGNSAVLGDTQHPTASGGGGTGFQTGAFGGGILNTTGTVNVNSCTFSGNSATGGLQSVQNGNIVILTGSGGGGISNGSGTIYVTNSTLFGNSVDTGTLIGQVTGLTSWGGGIFNSQGSVNLTFSTISGNSATGGTASSGATAGSGEGGGINNFTAMGTVNAKDTIIAGNTVSAGGLGPDFRNTLTSQGWNLIGNNKDATIIPAPGTADQIGTNASPINPLLDPLTNNGGPTLTMALQPGSPARDKGAAATDPVTGLPITTDQRGSVRPVDDSAIANATGGDGSDIGAFEVGGCVLTCPSNIMKSNDPNQCGAVVTYQSPVAVGSCTTVVCAPASGSFFSVGTTTVTCSITAGPSCSFAVTVTDTQAPTVTCPAHIDVSAPPSQSCASVNYAPPAANDNCSGATVTCSPPPGSCFPLGTTTVTCTAKDAAMNTGTCSFTITVTQLVCAITCPANITRSNDPNQCGATVTYPTPSVPSGCGAVTCSPASGTVFAKGTTTVTCSVAGGPSCSFTVTVNDTQAPALIACPPDVTAAVSLGLTCSVVNFATPASTDNCSAVTTACVPASGSCFPLGSTTVTCTATDSVNNKTLCSFIVKASVFDTCIQDDTDPSRVLVFSSITGDYVFCCGPGLRMSGRGIVTKKGGDVTLQHNMNDRKLQGQVSTAVKKGSATLQMPPSVVKCSIVDRDITNNSCNCAVPL